MLLLRVIVNHDRPLLLPMVDPRMADSFSCCLSNMMALGRTGELQVIKQLGVTHLNLLPINGEVASTKLQTSGNAFNMGDALLSSPSDPMRPRSIAAGYGAVCPRTFAISRGISLVLHPFASRERANLDEGHRGHRRIMGNHGECCGMAVNHGESLVIPRGQGGFSSSSRRAETKLCHTWKTGRTH